MKDICLLSHIILQSENSLMKFLLFARNENLLISINNTQNVCYDLACEIGNQRIVFYFKINKIKKIDDIGKPKHCLLKQSMLLYFFVKRCLTKVLLIFRHLCKYITSQKNKNGIANFRFFTDISGTSRNFGFFNDVLMICKLCKFTPI